MKIILCQGLLEAKLANFSHAIFAKKAKKGAMQGKRPEKRTALLARTGEVFCQEGCRGKNYLVLLSRGRGRTCSARVPSGRSSGQSMVSGRLSSMRVTPRRLRKVPAASWR